MRAGSLLVDAGIAGVVAGVLLVMAGRGRRTLLPRALFCLANLAVGAGNMITGDRWLGIGNLIASVYFAGLWLRDRAAGDPVWLREAMEADRARREQRLQERQLEESALGQSGSRSAGASWRAWLASWRRSIRYAVA
jgi:hypothetical protein